MPYWRETQTAPLLVELHVSERLCPQTPPKRKWIMPN